jgi:hypothetical protein
VPGVVEGLVRLDDAGKIDELGRVGLLGCARISQAEEGAAGIQEFEPWVLRLDTVAGFLTRGDLADSLEDVGALGEAEDELFLEDERLVGVAARLSQ